MVRDDDFDRRRARQDYAFDPGVERARTPGKQTLVEAESGARDGIPSSPGKRTQVDIVSRWTHGVAQGPDPVTETEFQVRKAREVMAKLAAEAPATEQRVLRAELRCHLDNAKNAGARAFALPDGRQVAESMLALIAEAETLGSA